MPAASAAFMSMRSKPAHRRSTSLTPSCFKMFMTSASPSSFTKRHTASAPLLRCAVEAQQLASTKNEFGYCKTMAPICLRTYSVVEKTATLISLLILKSIGSCDFLAIRCLSSFVLAFGDRSWCGPSSFAGPAAVAGGALTSFVSALPATNSSAFRMVVLAMLLRASLVRNALWGVMRTLLCARSRANFGSQCSILDCSSMLLKSLKKRSPSFSYTSKPTNLMMPALMPSMTAWVSIRAPRETLMRMTPGFIFDTAA
mmetsp:Transcript_106764/g.284052  ORF Transcript_106764/g.284052 Transcript_106764/m.284052 type:complete len:257 (+) Transcript_106764:723-1493(+)